MIVPVITRGPSTWLRLRRTPHLTSFLHVDQRRLIFNSKPPPGASSVSGSSDNTGGTSSIGTESYFKDLLKSGYNALYYSQYAFKSLPSISHDIPSRDLSDIHLAAKLCDKIYGVTSLEGAIGNDVLSYVRTSERTSSSGKNERRGSSKGSDGKRSENLSRNRILLCEIISLGQDGNPDCIAYLVSGANSTKDAGANTVTAGLKRALNLVFSSSSYSSSSSSSSSSSFFSPSATDGTLVQHDLPTVWIVCRGTHTRNDIFHDISWLASTLKLHNLELPAGIVYRIRNYKKSIDEFFSKVDKLLSISKSINASPPNLSSSIRGSDKYRVIFTGHSLGGAAALGLYFSHVSSRLSTDPNLIERLRDQCSEGVTTAASVSTIEGKSSTNLAATIEFSSTKSAASPSCLPQVITFGSPLCVYESPRYFEVPLSYNADMLKGILRKSISKVDDTLKNYSSISSSSIGGGNNISSSSSSSSSSSGSGSKGSSNSANNVTNTTESESIGSKISNSISNVLKFSKTSTNTSAAAAAADDNGSSDMGSYTDGIKQILQPKLHVDLRVIASRVHNIIHQFDVVPRIVGQHDLPAVIKSSIIGGYVDRLVSLGRAKRSGYEPFGLYYSLLTRGPELRKIVDKAVSGRGALNKIANNDNNDNNSSRSSSSINADSYSNNDNRFIRVGGDDSNLAIVEKHLATFPDSKAALAFAVLHDHSMYTIAVNMDDVIIKKK